MEAMWGEAWTGEKVWARLVDAFVRLPGTAVYSPRENVFLTGVDGDPIEPLEIIAVTAWALGREAPRRRHLLRAARCVSAGMSIQEYCTAHGIKRKTFDRWKVLVTTQIAAKIASVRCKNASLTMSKPGFH